MTTQSKRLLSLLLVFVLVLGLMPSVFAATDAGTQPVTEPAEPQTDSGSDLSDGTISEDELHWAELIAELPSPIEGYCPADPDNPYPYGKPVDNFFPSWFFEEDAYAVSPMADMDLIPDEMYDNMILRALAYTGYNVQWLKDRGYLYVSDYIASSLKTNAPSVLSDIGYWSSGECPNGDETVTDSSTVTGKAPNISFFESNGLVCASFVTYYLCNYLPNIEGVDTSVIYEKVKEEGADSRYDDVYYLTSVTVWDNALSDLASQTGSGVTKYTSASTAYANLVPGDVIVFAEDGSFTHIAIYAGTYDMYSASGTNRGEYHFIIHVGNSRGPEISTVEYMADSGSKTSTPVAWYHLEVNEAVDQTGFIEIYKKDPNGATLSGAKFKAVAQSTGDTYYIGPTDASGYAKSGELPLDTYVVTETVFPTGYEASGTTTWTVTLTKDTPNNTITINAVNKKITGSLVIQKATNTGKSLGGWEFGVYTDEACTNPISGSPFTTPASGTITITDLEPGTYYVKELSDSFNYWISDNGVKAVKVDGNSSSTVTVTNTQYGYGKIIKQTNTGGSLSGWKFHVYTDSALTTPVTGSPFTTDEDGVIVKDLLPGTYYVKEVDESDKYPDWDFDTTVRTLIITAGTTQSVTFTNNQAGYANIIKTTNTGANLGGWKFNIYTDAGCTTLVSGSPFTTDDNGVITVRIAPGTYYIQEVDESSLNPLWEYDTTIRQVVVNAGEIGTVSFENTHYGYGQIIKTTNTGGTLEGWKFEIFTDQACTKPISGSPFTTDAQGLIKTRLLPGSYWVREVDESDEKPEWEFDWKIWKLNITAGNTSSVSFRNIRKGYARIIKSTNTRENLGGWKFNIYENEACTVLGEGSPFITGDNGRIDVLLEPGTYWVQEVDESDKYPDWTYDTTVRKVTVTAGTTRPVIFTNTHYGYAEICKTTNSGLNLGGWSFDIFTDADCTSKVDGSPFVTDEDGKMSVRLLPGTYYVREVDESAAKPDWAFDTRVHEVTVKGGETASVTLENQQMGRMRIIKTMPDGGPVSGWVFDIHRKSDNTHIGTFTSDEDGMILSGYLMPGEYLVTEKLDPQSLYWCASVNPQTVTIKPGKTAEVTFSNRLKAGKIAIQKVDVTGEPLAGAEFLLEWSVDGTEWKPVIPADSLYVSEGTCSSEGLQDGRLVSDETGLVEFTGLHPDRLYRLTETAAPEGYQLLEGVAYEGNLPADQDLVVELTVVNVRVFQLPETGSYAMMLMTIAMTLAYGLCAVLVEASKRRAK